MGRLGADLAAINAAAEAGRSRPGQWLGWIGAVALVGALPAMALWNRAPTASGELLTTSGPLSAYVVTAPSPVCQSADCTVATVQGVAQDVRSHWPAVFVAPAVQVLSPPPGKVFVDADIRMPKWLALEGGPAHPFRLPIRVAPKVGSPGQGDDQLVQTDLPGYVSSVQPSGQTAAPWLDGAQIARLAPLVPPSDLKMSALRFQPLPESLTLDFPMLPSFRPEVGSRAMVQMEVREGESGSLGTTAETVGKITSVERRDDGTTRLQVQIEQDQRAQWFEMLRRRVAAERRGLGLVLPDHVSVSFEHQPVAVPLRGLKVPRSAAVEDAEGWRVWALMDGHAVPLMVRPLWRMGDRIMVWEVYGGAMGLPIRPADWRAMPATARRAVSRGMRWQSAPGGALLLWPDQALVAQPQAGLKPGAALRASP